MPKKRDWSKDEIDQIIKWYTENKYSINYISAKLLKCRPNTISKILKDNNITINNHKGGRVLNNEEEKTLIDLYTKKKYSQQEIANKFSCSTYIISNILKRNNIPTIIHPRKNKEQNDNYFDIIDTEHKAYWLGFIFADGNVYGNQLSIEISEKDKSLLEVFKEDLNLNNKISFRQRNNTATCCIRVVSPHLIETLSKYGIVADKTHKTTRLPEISENLLPHFLRGLIDGDGWISIDQNGYYHIGFVSNYSTTCEDFKKYCNIITDGLCQANITNKGGKNKTSCFQIQSKKATKRLATALYKDNTICLSRKYRLVEPLFDFKNDEDIV